MATAEYYRRTRAIRRKAAIARLGGKCARCPSKRELEFDHIDRKTKLYNIADIWSLSLVRLNLELDKCQLLCRACHIEKSREESTTTLKHGTIWKYQRDGCRCNKCVARMYRAVKEYRARKMRNQ